MEKTCTPGDGSTTQALLPYGHCIFKPVAKGVLLQLKKGGVAKAKGEGGFCVFSRAPGPKILIFSGGFCKKKPMLVGC